MDEIMAIPGIENDWDSPEIMELLAEKSKQFNFIV
jgi:hypothetical protein